MSNLNEFNDYGYNPNEVDSEIFLSDIPLSLMKETIRNQFEEPLEYRKNDYLQTFFNKYEFTKENMTEDDEEEVEELYSGFISFMEEIFKEFLDIGIPNLDDMSEEEQEEIIRFIYRYFIIDIRKNFVNVIYNYIKERKEKIAERMDKKKDVTYLSLKKYVDDEDEIVILSNLGEVINDILSEEFTIDEFFKYSRTDKNELEIDFVSDRYDTCDITGNFVSHYINMVDEELKMEIECKVRNKILKKYKKK